jgi:hypothetical protein
MGRRKGRRDVLGLHAGHDEMGTGIGSDLGALAQSGNFEEEFKSFETRY